MYKMLLLASFLAACGTTIPKDFTITTETKTDTSTDTAVAATTGDSSTDVPAAVPTKVITAPVTAKQIKYITTLTIPGVMSIASAAKIEQVFYFTGVNSAGFKILGYFQEHSDAIFLKEFTELPGVNFKAPDEMLYLTQGDAEIRLGDPRSALFYTVDPDTHAFVDAIPSQCAPQYAHASIVVFGGVFERFYNNTILGCGLTGGDAIFSQDIQDPSSGEIPTWLKPDNAPQYGFDGVNFFQYDTVSKHFVVFDKNFKMLSDSSTAGYANGSNNSVVVASHNGNVEFFGCQQTTCTFTTAQIQ